MRCVTDVVFFLDAVGHAVPLALATATEVKDTKAVA